MPKLEVLVPVAAIWAAHPPSNPPATRVRTHDANAFQLVRPDSNDGLPTRLGWGGTAATMIGAVVDRLPPSLSVTVRSEEHTSELQSLTNLVCRLLLAKK